MEVQVTVEVRMVLLPRQRDRNDMKQRQDRDINLLQERRIILDLNKTSTSLTIIRTEMATLPRNLILRQVAEDLDQKQVKFSVLHVTETLPKNLANDTCRFALSKQKKRRCGIVTNLALRRNKWRELLTNRQSQNRHRTHPPTSKWRDQVATDLREDIQ